MYGIWRGLEVGDSATHAARPRATGSVRRSQKRAERHAWPLRTTPPSMVVSEEDKARVLDDKAARTRHTTPHLLKHETEKECAGCNVWKPAKELKLCKCYNKTLAVILQAYNCYYTGSGCRLVP